MKKRVLPIILATMMIMQGTVPAFAELEEELIDADITESDLFTGEIIPEEENTLNEAEEGFSISEVDEIAQDESLIPEEEEPFAEESELSDNEDIAAVEITDEDVFEEAITEGVDKPEGEYIQEDELSSGGVEQVGKIIDSGICGDHLQWELEFSFSDDGTVGTGTLIISGKGEMYNWNSFKEVPWGNYSVNKITFQPGATSIGDFAFSDTFVSDVTIPDTVKRIGKYAFMYCSRLKTVTIPNSVTSLGEGAFSSSGITSITLPESITSVEDGLFSFCGNLSSVTIPKSVTKIGESAFKDCESLSDIYYGSTEKKWNAIDIEKNGNDCLLKESTTIHYTKEEEDRPDQIFFSDVTDPSLFYFEPVYWAVDKGITTGFKDNTFRPNNNCNRATVITFLWRLAGKPDSGITSAFSDMPADQEFARAITWASQTGLATGYNDGSIRPWATCNRVAIVTFIWRYAGRPEPNSIADFSDMTDNADFNKAISWAAENGITTGYKDGTFRPWNQCSRLAVVSFLYRYANL